MGAFDTIAAAIACPRCGDVHYHTEQTKFFEPDYDEQRWMVPGGSYALAELPDAATSEWVRIRDPISPARFTLLLSLDELFACNCGCPCGTLCSFVYEERLVLECVEAVDLETPLAPRVDFASGIVPWTQSWETYLPAARAFERLPVAERAALFARSVHEAPRISPLHGDVLCGPTRCEVCGDTRERVLQTRLAGVTRIGDAITEAALAGMSCLRAPRGRVRLLGDPGAFGCGCGAGRARYVATFERVDGALILTDLALRASDARDDLDYVER